MGQSVTYQPLSSGGIWVATGSGNSQTIIYSNNNGYSWNPAGTNRFTSAGYSVYFNVDRWVAVGNGGSSSIKYSLVEPSPQPTPTLPQPTPTLPQQTPTLPQPTPTLPQPTPQQPTPTPQQPTPTPTLQQPTPTPQQPTPTPPQPTPTPQQPTPTPTLQPTPTPPQPTPSTEYYLALTNVGSYTWTVNNTSSYGVPNEFTFISSWAFDPNYVGSGLVLSNNNTSVSGTQNSSVISNYSIPSSGKIMVSATITGTGGAYDNIFIGMCKRSYSLSGQLGNINSAVFSDFGVFYLNGGATYSSCARFNNNCIIDLAIDATNKKMWLRVNGGTWTIGNPETNTGGRSYSTLAP
jgi:hypothetical protein